MVFRKLQIPSSQKGSTEEPKAAQPRKLGLSLKARMTCEILKLEKSRINEEGDPRVSPTLNMRTPPCSIRKQGLLNWILRFKYSLDFEKIHPSRGLLTTQKAFVKIV